MAGHVPTPATKGAELIDRLNAAMLGAEVDDLELRRIRHGARQLMGADPVEAHTALGAIATLEGRADEVRKHFRVALQQSSHSAWVSRNYSCSLLALGRPDEALDIAREASERAPDDLTALEHLIAAALEAGRLLEARTFRRRFGKLSPGRSLPDESVEQMLGDAVDRGVFREESIREVLRAVREILAAAGVRRTSRSDLATYAADPDSFLFRVHVLASPERAAELNEALADRIAARPELMADPGVRFVPMFIGVGTDGGHPARAS